MKTAAGPTSAYGRLEFIDSLRGFALFGVFAANLFIFSGVAFLTDEQRAVLFDSPLDSLTYSLEWFLIENKFMGLFSLLFGISFWLFLCRATARGGSPAKLFYRRIFWLFVIGAVHGWLLWCFDILRFYALWAVLLPLFVQTSRGRLLVTALTAAVVLPAVVAAINAWIAPSSDPAVNYDALAVAQFTSGSYRDVLVANWKYDWHLSLSVSQIGYQVSVLGRLLLGLYVARTLDLANLEAHRPLLLRVLIAGALVGVAGSFVFSADLLRESATPALVFARRLIEECGHLGLTLAYAAGLGLAFLAARWRRVIRLLAPMGRMALTWYLCQTLFGIWLFYGFAPGPALMGRTPPSALVAVCLLGFVVQVCAAHLWLRRYRFGPAEWLWRTLTYWRIQPMSVSPESAAHVG